MEDGVGWADYLVFGLVMAISVGIGIFYGCFGSKQKTAKEYLLANRSMSPFPVAMSMMCTAVSAITLLSYPVEVYLFGIQFATVLISYVLLCCAAFYFYIPVYFELQVKSAYEFISIRFSHTTSIIVSILAVINGILLMSVTIYAPSLAINQVTGAPINWITLAIYGICIFYSTLGGLKAVLWTDVFQTAILIFSLIFVTIKGIIDVGGFSAVWDRAGENGRLNILNFDPDPRTRHTVWTGIIGGYFFLLSSYGSSQTQVQRYMSLPTIASAKRALMYNCLALILVVGLSLFSGLIIYASFYDCDPIRAQEISKSDQLLPLFIQRTSRNIPGLAGLFIAGLTCASMSSLSSALTSLSSVASYDYIHKLFPSLSDTRLSVIAKLCSLFFGVVSYAFVFVIQSMEILPITSSLLGMMLGPILGVFTLGMMFPWANSEGALGGLISALCIMVSLVVGQNLNAVKSQLPRQQLPLSTLGCPSIDNGTTVTLPDWKEQEYEPIVKVLSLSYTWNAGLGCCLVVLVGLILSFLVNWYKSLSTTPRKLIDRRCISPPLLKMYEYFFPDYFSHWIESQ